MLKNFSKTINIFMVLAFLFGMFLNLGTPKAQAVLVREISPKYFDNQYSTIADIYGYDFRSGTEVSLGDVKLEEPTVLTSNHMTAVVPAGLDEGVYSLYIYTPNEPVLIMPNAVVIRGSHAKLRVVSMEEVKIPSGLQTRIKFNKEARAKLLSGPTSEEMTVDVRKSYSKEHVLPFVFPFDQNYLYYLTQIVARDRDGNELTLPLKTRKFTRDGIKMDKEVLIYEAPTVKYDLEKKEAYVTMKANMPITIEFSKKMFIDDIKEKLDGVTKNEDSMEYKLTLQNLESDTLYYIDYKGKTVGNEVTNFQGAFRFYFSDPLFNDDGNTKEDLAKEKLAVVDEEVKVEEESEVKTEDKEITNDFYGQFREEDMWAVPYIEVLRDEGIVKGGNDGYFDPNRFLTRSEMAIMLSRASEFRLSEEPKTYFTDVPKTHHAFAVLAYLVEHEIDKGLGNGEFGVDQPITRKDAIQMLVKSLKGEIKTEFKTSSFKDVPLNSGYLPYIETALSEGWIKKSENFRPEDSLKRIEASKLLAISYGLADTIAEEDVVEVRNDDAITIEPVVPEAEETPIVPVVVETPKETATPVIETEDDSSGDDENSEADPDLMKLLEGLL